MTTRKIIVFGNASILVTLTLIVLGWPVIFFVSVLASGELNSGRIPEFAYGWHKALSEDLGPWARDRVASGRAATLSVSDIEGTEWPIFSSVFYLWATEALQEAAVAEGLPQAKQPRHYARETIDAATDLVADPGHAAWVRQHWGENYLDRENLFYRMLLINGLTSYQKLSGDLRYQPLLRQQVTSLAKELDASPFGLLDDYPGQCYPIDILPAIAAIQRADRVIGTENAEIVARAVRGFQDDRLDPSTGLPAYVADSISGEGRGYARGVGVAFMIIWAAETWPDLAKGWYSKFEHHFWQEGKWISGPREYPIGVQHAAFLADVDAGPVVYGIGTAASAFGIGAARTVGRLDHAYTLSTQALAAMFPMANRRMLGPWLLSNLTDAPFTGEAIMLFSFTRSTMPGVPVVSGPRQTPGSVYLVFGTLAALSLLIVAVAVRHARKRYREAHESLPPLPAVQVGIWVSMLVASVSLLAASYTALGIFGLLLAQFLPKDGNAGYREGVDRPGDLDA